MAADFNQELIFGTHIPFPSSMYPQYELQTDRTEFEGRSFSLVCQPLAYHVEQLWVRPGTETCCDVPVSSSETNV